MIRAGTTETGSTKETAMPQQVIYRGKSESERINDRLKNVHGPLKPNSVVETVPNRCVTSTYYGAAHVSPSRYEHDPVRALEQLKREFKGD
jgi:hypothetical protein